MSLCHKKEQTVLLSRKHSKRMLITSEDAIPSEITEQDTCIKDQYGNLVTIEIIKRSIFYNIRNQFSMLE